MKTSPMRRAFYLRAVATTTLGVSAFTGIGLTPALADALDEPSKEHSVSASLDAVARDTSAVTSADTDGHDAVVLDVTDRLVVTYDESVHTDDVTDDVDESIGRHIGKDVTTEAVKEIPHEGDDRGVATVIQTSELMDESTQQAVINDMLAQPGVVSVVPDKIVKAVSAFDASADHSDAVDEARTVTPTLAQVADIDSITASGSARNTEPYAFKQFNLARINAPGAWDLTKGAGKVIAVVDQGQVRNHPDQPRLIPGYDFVSDNFYARDGGGRDGDPTDMGSYFRGKPSTWHGQHVAGIAAAPLNGIGIAGVAPEASVQHLRVLGTGGLGYVTDFADAIYYASGRFIPGAGRTPQKADVINLSMAWPEAQCNPIMKGAIDYAYRQNVPVVVASGNSGGDAGATTPANCYGAIVTASSTAWNSLATYSNTGWPIDVIAPGGTVGYDIWSTIDRSTTSPRGATWGPLNGTSMAAPHVSGTIALIKSVYPQATIEQIRNILTSTGSAKIAGYPLINAQTAVSKAMDMAPKPKPAPKPVPAPAPKVTTPAPILSQFKVVNGMKAYYDRHGGFAKFGHPVQDEFGSTDGGYIQNFGQRSAHDKRAAWGFYWLPGYGAHSIKWGTAIGNYYENARWELGHLGYPTTDEQVRANKNVSGAIQRFDNLRTGARSYVYWSERTGAHAVNAKGAIYPMWARMGAWSKIGFPATDEIRTPGTEPAGRGGRVPVDGVRQLFGDPSGSQSVFYWSERTGAQMLNAKGAINHLYQQMGGPERLGFPVNSEQDRGGYVSVKFSHGTEIRWRADRGTWVVR